MPGTAVALAAAIRAGRLRAADAVEQALARIAASNPALNCFTEVLAERAREKARTVDAAIAEGRDPGPLAGVPFAAKNLFDIRDVVTLAGSIILRDRPPATADAATITRLEARGAILIGALNMDEFAYGFSTENEHYGPTRNPHDPGRIAGGSSGGSAAAVAAQMVPLTLGSDTNGSVRVPAALCGIFGLKPTYGRLDRSGLYPFVDSLDHVGLFARTTADLALAYDAMHDGPSVRSAVDTGRNGLKTAVLGGWFEQYAGDGVLQSVARVADALGVPDRVEIPHSDVARSAAFCITAAEGGNLHLDNLRSRPQDFDHATRDRLIAGNLLPAAVVTQARRFRSWYSAQAMRLFARYDLLIAPATICTAPRIGEATVEIGGRMVPVRANLGLYTQPISFIGLPVVCAPVAETPGLPLGVQIIAAPGREDQALALAEALESEGVFASRAI